jgi:RNA polymerase sigma factor (sigma-70 family)
MKTGRIEGQGLNHLRPSVELIEKTWRLMERTIEFVGHDEFDHAGFDHKLMATRPESLDRSGAIASGSTDPGIAFVSGLVQKPLLSQDEERYLFLRMNFLKSRAERGRCLLDLRKPDSGLVDQIETDLEEALCIRNQIVEGNLRLIVAIARKLSGSLDRMSDLISEGMAPLIRSVELFDIGLGYRFSTYATWAVRNQMLRRLKRIALTPEFSPGEDTPSLENLPDKRTSIDSEATWPQLQMQTVNRLLSSLSERERSIVAARFGLLGQPHGQSLAVIAGQIGLCKERVRQILLQSLAKLRLSIVSDVPDSIF